jgi:LCP family protein required for cell wall assembly
MKPILENSPSPDPANTKIRNRKKIKIVFWSIVGAILAVALWIGFTGIYALNKITAQNTDEGPSFFKSGGTVEPTALKREGDGRINILLLGVGGSSHPGGSLADTIQVYSIDPINKSASIVSIPRDLYVTRANGTKSKINAVYADAVSNCTKTKNSCPADVDAGGQAMKEVVGTILDLPIHYFIRIDFDGFAKVIDTLGGIQINVEKPLNDPFFPDAQLKGYEPLYIPAGLQTMTGSKALKYARSRETTSDFDRARRQQQVINAVKDKALKLNVLANPKKLTDILNTLGAHLRTDIKLDEMKRLAELAGQINTDSTKTKVLDTAADGPLKSINDPIAGYIILPKKGANDYTDLRLVTYPLLTEPYVTKEAATVMVINASGSDKVGVARIATLKALGYTVVDGAAAAKTQPTSTIAAISDKPYSVSLLKHRFNAANAKTSTTAKTADIVLTLGVSETTR